MNSWTAGAVPNDRVVSWDLIPLSSGLVSKAFGQQLRTISGAVEPLRQFPPPSLWNRGSGGLEQAVYDGRWATR